MSLYVALLRGINVGGKNIIRMDALRACFEEQGFGDVSTYIQSGNVIFSSREPKSEKLVKRIEKALAERFRYGASVVVRSKSQMKDVVGRAPKGFGKDAEKFRYDVIFLKEPLSPATAVKTVPARPGVDEVHTGPGVLYFSRLASKATMSHLAKLASMPIYQQVTVRNFRTTTKLVALLGESAK
jgi:uncharacterized protein (DUF1697 family)